MAEMSRLEDVVVNAHDLIDAELAYASFIAAQIGEGLVPGASRRVCWFYGMLARRIDDLGIWRDDNIRHMDERLTVEDDEPTRHFRVPCGLGWPG